MTTQTISGTDTAAVAVFDNHEFADAAVKKLAKSGFDITRISVIGRGFHTEQNVSGLYNAGDRVKVWGSNGAFWGGLWGLFFGGLFMMIPFFGPIVVVGHLAMMVVAAVEGAVVVGGLSALGAALYSTGIPKDSVLRYEDAVKAEGFLVIVHGTDAEVARARAILANDHPTQLDVHEHLDMNPPAAARHPQPARSTRRKRDENDLNLSITSSLIDDSRKYFGSTLRLSRAEIRGGSFVPSSHD